MSRDAAVIDVTSLIDERKLTPLQMGVVLLCGLVCLCDGMDTQSIGVAMPFIIKMLGLKVTDTGPVLSAALFGAMVGALVFGPVADRYGRKRLLVVATALFGLFTLLTGFATNYWMLMTIRFVAGLGLGGATPCFFALSSEYAPRRLRAALVTAMWSGFALGGMVGGFLNQWLIADYGWQPIFYVGGLVPLVLAVVVAWWMPESLRFLLTQTQDQEQVRRIVRRMFPDIATASTVFVGHDKRLSGVPMKHLFAEGRAIGTLLLWMPFFLGFGSIVAITLWTPTILRLSGIAPADTAFVLAFSGLGGFIACVVGGTLLDRYGILKVQLPGFLLAAVGMVGLGYGASSVSTAAVATFFLGLGSSLGTAGAIALASIVYPTAIRSTGTGWAMGVGRFGQVLSPLLIGLTLAHAWNAQQILLVIAAGPTLAAFFVLLLWLHMGVGGRKIATASFGTGEGR